jgi:urease accessory protein
MTGFADGLLNPLLVPTHFMGIAALALLIGQQGWGHSVALVYVFAILAGLGTLALAYVPGLAPEGLLAASAPAGLLVAWARPLPLSAGVLLAGAIGLALALDSPPQAISLREANLTLVGTAIGAAIVLLALVQVSSHFGHDWQRTGARVVGSWIAASAILALALRVAG